MSVPACVVSPVLPWDHLLPEEEAHLPLLPDRRWGGGGGLLPQARGTGAPGKVEQLGCIALVLGEWSDFRKDFSLHPVIEDLTHKTGNFKQFNIFCNMLESALTQVGAGGGG